MPANSKNKNTTMRYCSFCGRSENQVEFLIPSPTGAMICDNCIEACNQIIYDHEQMLSENDELSLATLPKPAEIKAMLDEYVIGQDAAKKGARGIGIQPLQAHFKYAEETGFAPG